MANLSSLPLIWRYLLGFAGLLCVVKAGMGGGVKFSGAELPVINSVRRQVFLAVISV